MEVKTNNDIRGIKKDLNSINDFVSFYRYETGVFLLINYSKDDLIYKINRNGEFKKFLLTLNTNKDKIHLIFKKIGRRHEHILLSEIIKIFTEK